MTKEKWIQINQKEFTKYSRFQYFGLIEPDRWEANRKDMIAYIKAIDEATEVYNMENKNAKG